MTDTDKNILYWKSHIIHKLKFNLDLFAEFELDRYNTITYFRHPIKFNDGYVLKEITKTELLRIIKEVMKNSFPDHKYFVSIRAINYASDYSSHHYIVVTLIQP